MSLHFFNRKHYLTFNLKAHHPMVLLELGNVSLFDTLLRNVIVGFYNC